MGTEAYLDFSHQIFSEFSINYIFLGALNVGIIDYHLAFSIQRSFNLLEKMKLVF